MLLCTSYSIFIAHTIMLSLPFDSTEVAHSTVLLLELHKSRVPWWARNGNQRATKSQVEYLCINLGLEARQGAERMRKL